MHDDRWLVKSSGKILGPFTLEELIQHLRARTLSIIDEVRDPQTRWSFIREHALLSDVVRQLRDEDDSHQEATQSNYVSGNKTLTSSVTENLNEEFEMTPNPVTPPPTFGNRSTDARPIAAVERTVKPILGAGKTFGSMQDQRVQMQIQKKRSLTKVTMWGVAVLLLGFTGWFIASRQKKTVAKDQARQFIQVAHEQVRYGQFWRALDFINKAAEAMFLQAEDQILRAELLLQVDGKSVEALHILSEVTNLSEPRLVREMGLAKALVYMKDQRWEEANKELNALLGYNPADEEALHNLAIVQALSGKSTESWATVNDLQDRGYRSAQLLILKGLLALSWPDKNTQTAHVNLVGDELKRDLESSFDLRFEKFLLLMNLRMHAGKTDEVLKVLNSMWDADPFDSRNFLEPLAVDRQLVSWDRLSPMCDRIIRTIPDHEGSRALGAICLFMRGDSTQALQKIDESRKQLSQSTLLAAAQALLFYKVGRAPEAKTLLQLAPEETLGHLVKGQICQEEKDWPCAEEAWKRVLAVQPKNPMALYGQAFVAKQRGSDNAAREQINKAILIAPGYRPFLEARGDSSVF
jgi:tetratricopeptide (TPR) repeat protein